jgi:hypothetical protein
MDDYELAGVELMLLIKMGDWKRRERDEIEVKIAGDYGEVEIN